jgi:two-component system, response regulator YesN
MKIVIVEDEFKTRKGIINLIKKINPKYEIIGEAANGIEATKIITEKNPDLVITDIRMPEMNGLEMLEDFKKNGSKFRTVILTGYSEFEYAKQALKLGVSEYLLKPVIVEDVKKMLLNIQLLIENEKKKVFEDKKIITIENAVKNIQQVHKENQENSFNNLSEHIESFYDENNKIKSAAVRNVLNVVKKHFKENITLEEIADKIHLTPEYLSSLFYKEVGINYSTYIKEFRINKAKELLTKTDLKVYEIAENVGYPDPKYFCRVFKEVTGFSTGEFHKIFIN